MNDKTKKWLVIASGLVLSAVLLAVIGAQFNKSPVIDEPLPTQNRELQNIVVDKPDMTEKETQITVPPIEISEQTEMKNGALDKATEQTIQPDPTKPKYTEEQLENPEQKPNGEKLISEDKPVEHDKVEMPSTNHSSGGLPGFDNVPNMGDNQTILDDEMYENGNKVGIMD